MDIFHCKCTLRIIQEVKLNVPQRQLEERNGNKKRVILRDTLLSSLQSPKKQHCRIFKCNYILIVIYFTHSTNYTIKHPCHNTLMHLLRNTWYFVYIAWAKVDSPVVEYAFSHRRYQLQFSCSRRLIISKVRKKTSIHFVSTNMKIDSVKCSSFSSVSHLETLQQIVSYTRSYNVHNDMLRNDVYLATLKRGKYSEKKVGNQLKSS